MVNPCRERRHRGRPLQKTVAFITVGADLCVRPLLAYSLRGQLFIFDSCYDFADVVESIVWELSLFLCGFTKIVSNEKQKNKQDVQEIQDARLRMPACRVSQGWRKRPSGEA